jgi:hypothetical protein
MSVRPLEGWSLVSGPRRLVPRAAKIGETHTKERAEAAQACIQRALDGTSRLEAAWASRHWLSLLHTHLSHTKCGLNLPALNCLSFPGRVLFSLNGLAAVTVGINAQGVTASADIVFRSRSVPGAHSGEKATVQSKVWTQL